MKILPRAALAVALSPAVVACEINVEDDLIARDESAVEVNNGMFNNGMFNNGMFNNGMADSAPWSGPFAEGVFAPELSLRVGQSSPNLISQAFTAENIADSAYFRRFIHSTVTVPGTDLAEGDLALQALEYAYACAMPAGVEETISIAPPPYDPWLDAPTDAGSMAETPGATTPGGWSPPAPSGSYGSAGSAYLPGSSSSSSAGSSSGAGSAYLPGSSSSSSSSTGGSSSSGGKRPGRGTKAPAAEAPTTVSENPTGSKTLTLRGLVGLAPGWATGPCDLECQQWVTACLAARTNAFGVEVMLDATAPFPGLWEQTDPANYSFQEAAFGGNVFTSTPSVFACTGEGEEWSITTKVSNQVYMANHLNERVCGSPDGCEGFVHLGMCDDIEECGVGWSGYYECDDPADSSSIKTNRMITTHLEAHVLTLPAPGDFDDHGEPQPDPSPHIE